MRTKEPTAAQRRGGLCKKYGPWFIWGQLNGWYKQTVYDPTASLSAERRGTISLPDIECCYGGPRSRYSAKVGLPAADDCIAEIFVLAGIQPGI